MIAKTRALKASVYKPALIAAAVSAVLATSQIVTPVFSATAPQSTGSQSALAASMPASLADVIETVKPAVVTISTSGNIASSPMGPDFGPDFQLPPNSPFGEYFHRFFKQQPRMGHENRPEVQGQGSGFIIDATGHIVTNNHVIRHADEITVTLSDGTEYQAEVKGQDAKTDLALLKIEGDEPFPFVSFGDSDRARTGDWVIAIGNPFGLGGTATTGIISARGRDIQSGPFDDFIQIDAPINRGNSGGPVFDTTGQVIGVNTAIVSPNGGNVGIGFAIPSTVASAVIDELREHGQIERGWLGVQIQPVTSDIAQSLGLKEDIGALVAGVVPDSPAAEAGILPGDVITAFNGQTITHMKELPWLVAEAKANESMQLQVWRHGKQRTLEAVIGALPGDEQMLAANDTDKDAKPTGKLGLALGAITPELRQRYGLADDVDGALVMNVREDSPAAKKGLRVGDVIAMVGQTDVSTPRDVVREVEQALETNADVVLLLVARGDNEHFVALNLA